MFSGTFLVVAAFALFTSCVGQTEVAEAPTDPYEAFKIVPQILPEAPLNPLQVTYRSGATVDFGTENSPTQLTDPPLYSYPIEEGALYTIIMFDPDVPVFPSFLHFLSMDVPANDAYRGVVVQRYMPPTPLPLTGKHRYIFMVYKQSNYTQGVSPQESLLLGTRLGFSINEFVAHHDLETPPVAGNFLISSFSSVETPPQPSLL